MMETVLVTGAAGFIGSHIAKELVDRDYRVLGIDDLSGGFIRNVPNGCEFHKVSVNDGGKLDVLFNSYDIDYIYHFAAYAAEGLSHHIRKYNYENNVVGSVNMINRAINHDVKKFVFASSAAVFGHNASKGFRLPIDPYGIAKYTVEQDLHAAHEYFGLDYVVFRPHNVYGPKQKINDKYRNVVGIFIRQVMQNKPITIFGDGNQTRCFTYIDDIVPPMVDAIEMDHIKRGMFNVGSDNPCSIVDLAHTVKKVMGKPNIEIKHLQEREEADHVNPPHSSFYDVFDVSCDTPLEEGVWYMVKWARNHGLTRPREFDNIEIERELPESW